MVHYKKIKMATNEQNPFQSTETTLKLIKEVFEFSINPRDFMGLSFDVRDALGRYTARIMQKMYGDQIQKEVPVTFYCKVPAGWWQHFKQENFPAWLLRKYPVKYVTFSDTKVVEINRKYLFPDAYIEGHPILGKFLIRDDHRVRPYDWNKPDSVP